MARETTIARKAGVSPRTMNFATPGSRGLDRVWNAVDNRAQSILERDASQSTRLINALVRMRRRMRDLE